MAAQDMEIEENMVPLATTEEETSEVREFAPPATGSSLRHLVRGLPLVVFIALMCLGVWYVARPHGKGGHSFRQAALGENGQADDMKVSLAASKTPEYVMAGIADKKCPSGYDQVLTHSECEQAASALGEEYAGKDGRSLAVYGCNYITDGFNDIRFITDGWWSQTGFARLVCGPPPGPETYVCTCDNGKGAKGHACPSNGGKACKSCDQGYELDGDKCVGSVCTEDLPSGPGIVTEDYYGTSCSDTVTNGNCYAYCASGYIRECTDVACTVRTAVPCRCQSNGHFECEPITCNKGSRATCDSVTSCPKPFFQVLPGATKKECLNHKCDTSTPTSIDTVTCCGGQYAYAYPGDNECPEGYENIRDESDCSAAASYLVQMYGGSDSRYGLAVDGCNLIEWIDSYEVLFITNGFRSQTGFAQLICKLAPPSQCLDKCAKSPVSWSKKCSWNRKWKVDDPCKACKRCKAA